MMPYKLLSPILLCFTKMPCGPNTWAAHTVKNLCGPRPTPYTAHTVPAPICQLAIDIIMNEPGSRVGDTVGTGLLKINPVFFSI